MSDPSSWRTCFMGTPELAVPALQALAASTNLVQVVTQPDRPAGRGRRLQAPPVKQAAEALGVPVWQPEQMRGAEADPRLADLDLIVVLAYGEILRQPVLDAPRIACLNLHASLLPRWRGASPLQAVLRAGEAETGTSVMGMVPALDAGPVYLRHRLAIPAGATLPWLHDAIAENAAEALRLAVQQWTDLTPEDQVAADVTWCGKLGRSDGEIDWSASAVAIERQIRAYTPVPGCWSRCGSNGDETLGILGVEVIAESETLGKPGTVVATTEGVLVQCGTGVLALTSVKPAGRRAMPVAAWRNGYQIPQYLGD